MAAISFFWIICKITILFYALFFFITFATQPMVAIAMVRQTVYSWKLLFTIIKQKITIGIMQWKLNKVTGKAGGYTHVVHLRKA